MTKRKKRKDEAPQIAFQEDVIFIQIGSHQFWIPKAQIDKARYSGKNAKGICLTCGNRCKKVHFICNTCFSRGGFELKKLVQKEAARLPSFAWKMARKKIRDGKTTQETKKFLRTNFPNIRIKNRQSNAIASLYRKKQRRRC